MANAKGLTPLHLAVQTGNRYVYMCVCTHMCLFVCVCVCMYNSMYMHTYQFETGLSHPGQTGHILCGLSGSDLDLTLTALLEYFDLLAHALKVWSCYLFSWRLAC